MQHRRIFFDLADPEAWVPTLARGAFVPTRLPLQLGEVFTLTIRMKRVSRPLELPVRVLGRRMPRGAKGVLSAGVVVSLADPHHPTAKLLMELAGGGVVDFEARLRERLRIDDSAILDSSLDVRSLLLRLLDDDEAAMVSIDVSAQPGDRLRLRLGALDLDAPFQLEVAVRGVVLRDGHRAVRLRLFDEAGRQQAERALKAPDLVTGNG